MKIKEKINEQMEKLYLELDNSELTLADRKEIHQQIDSYNERLEKIKNRKVEIIKTLSKDVLIVVGGLLIVGIEKETIINNKAFGLIKQLF